jgi:hypothetical protein
MLKGFKEIRHIAFEFQFIFDNLKVLLHPESEKISLIQVLLHQVGFFSLTTLNFYGLEIFKV